MGYQQVNKKLAANPQSKTSHCAKPAPAKRAPVHLFNHLQQTIGNHGLGRLVQAKLKISQPDDAYEQEADHVADQVMRMAEPAAIDGPLAVGTSGIQRMCTDCEEEEQAMRQVAEQEEEEETEQPVQMKQASGPTPEASAAVEASVRNVTAGGQSLSESTRAFFEPRFGHDFSDVRIHSDHSAAESAQSLNARAYTVGPNIVFGSGEFAPETSDGRRLLTHELVHVVQQGGAPRRSSQAQGIDRSQKPSGNDVHRQSKQALPALSPVPDTIQRQDPFKEMEGEKPPEESKDPITKACGKPSGSSPWVEVGPDRFVSIADNPPKMTGPVVNPVGCPPSGTGNVVFVSGAPAWDFDIPCSDCTLQNPKAAPKIEVGYIQTVEKALSGGVYFQQTTPGGKWDWAGNDWLCVSNARDGHATSTAPWFGPDASGNFGPVPFGQCPRMADNPFVKLPSHQGKYPLRRMRIDGIFNVWLIAQMANKPPVFIHNWSIECWVVAILDESGHPCSKSAWVTYDMKSLKSSGPGKGSATPVLTGATANTLKAPC